jgi:hypothetical protein
MHIRFNEMVALRIKLQRKKNIKYEFRGSQIRIDVYVLHTPIGEPDPTFSVSFYLRSTRVALIDETHNFYVGVQSS